MTRTTRASTKAKSEASIEKQETVAAKKVVKKATPKKVKEKKKVDERSTPESIEKVEEKASEEVGKDDTGGPVVVVNKIASTEACTSNESTKAKERMKESKSKRKAELRKKNMGIGIQKIDLNAPAQNKKITFDDYIDEEEEEQSFEQKKVENSQLQETDDESDDEVEQVTASVAKDEALQSRAAERKTRIQMNAFSQKRKRKSKEIEELDDDEDDELDDDFFSMVDSAKENDFKMKKLKKDSDVRVNKLGRHTTFVSEENDSTSTKSINADHNIEIVVLPSSRVKTDDENQQVDSISKGKATISLSSDLSTEPSKTALLFCRGNHGKQRNNKIEPLKKSRKMKYKFSLGKPSANFAVKRGSRK
jgi:hypothetical protein